MDINLQLFADEEEIENVENVEDVEDVEDVEGEEDLEIDEGEPEGDVTEDEPEKPKPDKTTSAIIREKRQNKILRDKLAAIEKEKADLERGDRDRKYKQKLIDEGYSEEEADERVNDRREREELKQVVRELRYGQQADKLSVKYPDIHDHLNEFIQIIEATKNTSRPMTLEKLCKAEFGETTAQEIKTKAEQEALLTRQKAKSKQVVPGEDKSTGVIKFSPVDEEAYKFYAARNPGTTRKAYNEILKIKRG